jgi:hypothetical protein
MSIHIPNYVKCGTDIARSAREKLKVNLRCSREWIYAICHYLHDL